jgi:branched-chain amino acid transport system permease protein
MVFQIILAKYSQQTHFRIKQISKSDVIVIESKPIKLAGSSFGLSLRALSEDEIFAQSFGKNVYLSKVIAFTASAMLAAIPGVLYAHYITYIDPTSFTVDESIFILSIVILGGMRNLRGSLIASAFLVLLPEALRFIGMPSSIAANTRQIIYGGALIFTMYSTSKASK